MEKDEPKNSKDLSPDDVTCKIQGSTIVDPSVELEHLYLLEENDETKCKYDYDESKGGKWILFIEINHIYSMWKKSCFLYRNGKLEGIKSLKASTGKKNPRSSTRTVGVIIFHCGPSDNERLMLRYGMNIVQLLRYTNSVGSIPYKSDKQSALGTSAMGIRLNSLYKLPVPFKPNQKSQREGEYSWRSSVPVSHDEPRWRWRWRASSTAGREDFYSWKTRQNSVNSSTNVPSARLDVLWLEEPEDFIESYGGKIENCGHWLMFFSTDLLDHTWKKAIELFRQGDLPRDVQCLRVTTKLHSYKTTVGVLKFLVEVQDDIDSLKGIGRTLARLMKYEYYCKTGYMVFRSHGETICSVEVEKPVFP